VAGRRALVALLSLPAFMVVLDSNAITVALPSIRRDLGFSHAALQWVVSAFSLGLGGTLLVAGRACDIYDVRRLLVLGVGAFSATSAAAALAASPAALVLARAGEGLAAAAALPASLALFATSFEEGEPRNRALGIYGSAVSVAFVAGVALGGALTQFAGWRAVLLVNVPLGAVAALLAPRLIARSPPRRPGAALPVPPAVAGAGAVVALLAALGTGTPGLLLPAALLGSFAHLLDRGRSEPLIPRGLLRRRTVTSACAAALLTVGAGVGVMFVLSLQLQEAGGYGAGASGLLLSPLGVAGATAGALVPAFARRIGLARTVALALAVQAAGVGALVPLGSVGLVLAGTAVVGIGHFGATAGFTALATSGLPADRHGVTMGLLSSGQQLGGAVGLALLVAIATGGGPRWALAAAAGLSLLAAALVLALNRSVRRPRRGWRTTRRRAPSARRADDRARAAGVRARRPRDASCS
jgi:MFS family permease